MCMHSHSTYDRFRQTDLPSRDQHAAIKTLIKVNIARVPFANSDIARSSTHVKHYPVLLFVFVSFIALQTILGYQLIKN